MNELTPDFKSPSGPYSGNNRGVRNIPQIEAAEVVDIILDESHPDYYKPDLDSLDQGHPIGTIKFRRYATERNKNQAQCFFATPLDPYIKQYPVKHEIVAIYPFPCKRSGVTTQAYSFYYSHIVNIHNLINSNELPFCTSINPPEMSANSPASFEGDVAFSSDTKINIGETFEQNTQITDLLPFEGDVIFQGRWGNTIRFGSTVPKRSDKNQWSSRGDAGNPLIIIQSTKNTNTSPPNHIVEKIDEAASAIYICDGQLIPLSVASRNLSAFEQKPELPKSKEAKQVIISSDRVIINGGPADRKGDVMIFGKQFISLSSAGTVNISSDKEINIVSSKEVRLGSPTADQRAVLGDELLEIINELFDLFIKHTHPSSTGPTSVPTSPIPEKILRLKQKFELKVLSKKVKLQ